MVVLHVNAHGSVEEIELVSSASVSNENEEEVSCISITVLKEQADEQESRIINSDLDYKKVQATGLVRKVVKFYIYCGDKFAISQR